MRPVLTPPSQSLCLQHLFGQKKAPSNRPVQHNTKTAPVLVSLDVDRSLVQETQPDVTHDTIQMLNRLHDQHAIRTVLNTGNSLERLKKYDFGKKLTGLKLDGMALSDGNTVFLNQKPNTTTADRWIQIVTPKDASPQWRQHLDQTLTQAHWNSDNVAKAFERIQKTIPLLKTFSVVKVAPLVIKLKSQDFLINAQPARLKPAIEALTEALDHEGIQTQVTYAANEIPTPHIAIKIRPKGVNKAHPIDYFLNQWQSKAVVTLGDSHNDLPALMPKNYGSHKTVANHPVLLKGDSFLEQALDEHPRKTLTQITKLPETLKKVILKALATLTLQNADTESASFPK